MKLKLKFGKKIAKLLTEILKLNEKKLCRECIFKIYYIYLFLREIDEI